MNQIRFIFKIESEEKKLFLGPQHCMFLRTIMLDCLWQKLLIVVLKNHRLSRKILKFCIVTNTIMKRMHVKKNNNIDTTFAKILRLQQPAVASTGETSEGP